MKKILILFFASTLILGACDDKDTNPTSEAEKQNTEISERMKKATEDKRARDAEEDEDRNKGPLKLEDIDKIEPLSNKEIREISQVPNKSTKSSYTYEERTAIDDVIDHIKNNSPRFLSVNASFDEGDGIASVGIAYVDTLKAKLGEEGEMEKLIDTVKEWSRAFAEAAQDYNMQTYIVENDSHKELIFVLENGKLMYNALEDKE